MKRKTMLEIAIEIISQDTSRTFTFDELFQQVEAQLKDYWMTVAEQNDFDLENNYDKLRTKKMGELYRLLTVDKRFVRNTDGTWESATFEVYK